MADDANTVESLQTPARCPACGAPSRRPEAHFCATCGRALASAEYLPADALRSSYHHQHHTPLTEHPTTGGGHTFFNAPAAAGVLRALTPEHTTAAAQRCLHHHRRPQPKARPVFFTGNTNGVSTTALAFLTYALVPYLGILFCPGAVALGILGWRRAARSATPGRRASFLSILLGLVIFCLQLVLWWLLYKVPEWALEHP